MGKQRTEYEGYNRDVGFDTKMTYDANNNTIYVGRAFPGAAVSDTSWQIYKMAYDANNNMTDLRWANGNDNFDKIWNNRATYTYLEI